MKYIWGKKEPRNAQHNQAARKVNRKSQHIWTHMKIVQLN